MWMWYHSIGCCQAMNNVFHSLAAVCTYRGRKREGGREGEGGEERNLDEQFTPAWCLMQLETYSYINAYT